MKADKVRQRIRLEQHHFRRTDPTGPVIKPIKQWPSANQGCYDRFRAWLRQASYSESSVMLYSVAARLAFGLLDTAYWQIDPVTDLAQVRAYIAVCYPSLTTRQTYDKGLSKLAHFLSLSQPTARPRHSLNWRTYEQALPEWLIVELRAYLTLRQRAWLPEQQHRASLDLLSHLTLFLRWLGQRQPLTSLADLTPQRWFDYLDQRLAQGISPITLNGQLANLQAFLRSAQEQGQPICEPLLRVETLTEPRRLPRDIPLAHLKRLYPEIERAAQAEHVGLRRMGLLDRAWFLLMLHSGLRTGEIRRLRLGEVEWAAGRVRLEQSKGLKDRLVCLSQPTIAALQAYLAVRGPASTDHLFLYRHQPLSVSYCLQRLKTYGQQCGIVVTPHQLRHSCATLLLNAGAPILTVQTILGHKYIDTTLGYARLYDGTVAADYYRAMSQIEQQLRLVEGGPEPPTTPAHLLALVDALREGTLNENQQQTVQHLRAAIVALAETET